LAKYGNRENCRYNCSAHSIDSRLQHVLFKSNVRTRSKLQAELKAFTFDKKQHARDDNLGPNQKNQRNRQLYVTSVQRRDIKLLNVEVKCDKIERRNRSVKNQMSRAIGAANWDISPTSARKTEVQPSKI